MNDMSQQLDNPFWFALNGMQACYSLGTKAARRFGQGFSPIVAFADAQRPSFEGLDAFIAPGERLFCDAWPAAAPRGWAVEHEVAVSQMTWQAAAPKRPVGLPEATRLGPDDLEQMIELVGQTHPGPFGPRTPDLGEYWGIFDGKRLVAMAGERAQLPGFREVSGVCTRPGYTGRGYARHLVGLLVARQLGRGETPFLHVVRSNERAFELYQGMGFGERRRSAVRVLVRH
jgi:ribosomal protein S18 acetylase RimI-like enzyme